MDASSTDALSKLRTMIQGHQAKRLSTLGKPKTPALHVTVHAADAADMDPDAGVGADPEDAKLGALSDGSDETPDGPGGADADDLAVMRAAVHKNLEKLALKKRK